MLSVPPSPARPRSEEERGPGIGGYALIEDGAAGGAVTVDGGDSRPVADREKKELNFLKVKACR